jgi:hypothetical protein
MKTLINAASRRNRQSFASQTYLTLTSILIFSLFFAACKKEAAVSNAEVLSSPNNSVATESNPISSYSGLSFQTVWELQQARAATSKYLRFQNALNDGYVDINVVVPEMGYHYLKAANLDAEFDFRKPEILVYNKKDNDSLELVAVEYAVPISLSANPPAGFTGNGDEWSVYQGVLWTLHAWVWTYNPEGVFNPTNPLVHLH